MCGVHAFDCNPSSNINKKKIPGRGLPDSWQYLQLGLVLLRQYVSSTLTNYPWWHEVRLDSWPFLFWFTRRSDGILRGRHISYPVSQIESTVKASMLDLKNLFSDHKLLLFFAPYWKWLSNRKKDWCATPKENINRISTVDNEHFLVLLIVLSIWDTGFYMANT